jgi:hypothetical protein
VPGAHGWSNYAPNETSFALIETTPRAAVTQDRVFVCRTVHGNFDQEQHMRIRPIRSALSCLFILAATASAGTLGYSNAQAAPAPVEV